MIPRAIWSSARWLGLVPARLLLARYTAACPVMGAERRKAKADDARAGAYFTDGETLYEVFARRENATVGKRPARRYDECLLGDAMAEGGVDCAGWVPVDEVEGLEVVREAPPRKSVELADSLMGR